MIQELRRVSHLPEFPENRLGLRRGSELEATDPAVNQLSMKVGQKILIGYDGEYVRCGPFTWSIEKIVREIEIGIWQITGNVLDLSDPEDSREFALIVEQLELIESPLIAN